MQSSRYPRRTVKNWESPSSANGVQEFLGFANFYRRFIKNCSTIVSPMTRLTRKDTTFEWGTKQEEALRELKATFTTAPILRHFDWERPIVVETDTSDY